MAMKAALVAAIACLVGLASCGEARTPTQVIVAFGAEPALRSEAAGIQITVFDRDGEVILDRTDAVSGSGDLARVPVVPQGDDATRTFEIRGELLTDENESLGVERALVGFIADELTHVLLAFDESCRGVEDCGSGRRCVLGQCVGACVQPADEMPQRESSSSCSSCESCEAARCVALQDGTDCGCEGDSCQAGECVVAQEVRDVALGQNHSCARAGDAVYCWGDNEHGQLGVAGVEASFVPLVPVPPASFHRRVQATAITTCILEGSGERHCFGENTLGQLGNGETNAGGPEVFSSSEPSLRDLVAGGHHFCASTSAQEAWCWGYNTHGQLGLGTDSHHENAPQRSLAFDEVDEIDAGGFQTCVIDEGELSCVGFNDSGQLGVGDTESRLEPVRPGCDSDNGEPCFDDYTQISSGSFHSCALRAGGELYCWGGNANGQVGNGVIGTDEPLPERVGAEHAWTVLSAGFQHTCALDDAGQGYCWGSGSEGRLGNGLSEKQSSLAPVAAPEFDTRWVDIITSKTGGHSCAIEGDGSLWCWGDNALGQLARDPAAVSSSPVPRRVCFSVASE